MTHVLLDVTVLDADGAEIEATSPDIAVLAQFFAHCLAIAHDRSLNRQSVWRESGARGQAFHVQAKAERLFLKAMKGTITINDLDDAADCANYAGFLANLVTIGDLNGSWPWLDPKLSATKEDMKEAASHMASAERHKVDL